MGLFDKKYCDICGEKIGLLGNRKLENGNMCKDCAKKLSPFFSDRRSSTVDEIKQQLAYREQNKQTLSSFTPVFTFGDRDKVYIDPMKQSFVVSGYKPGNWSDENPDVIPLSSVISCNMRVDEDKDEIYTQGKDGQRVSYNPPRYKYTYDFYVDITVNNPYFDEINAKLNDRDVEGVGSMEYNRYQQAAQQIINNLMQNRVNMNMGMNNGMGMNQGYAPANAFANQQAYQNPAFGMQTPNAYQQNPYGQQQAAPFVQQNQYNQPPVQQNQYVQQPVSQNWICPACNATNDGGQFCSFCGARRNG